MQSCSPMFTPSLEPILEHSIGDIYESRTTEGESSEDQIVDPIGSLLSSDNSPAPGKQSTLHATETNVPSPPQNGVATYPIQFEPLIKVPFNHITAPHEFENEFVRGKLLFMVHSSDGAVPEPPDVRKLFKNRKQLFWIQAQLQFKQIPSGIVYIGGEVPRPMSLSFFTGGMAKIILSLLQSFMPGVHYSFGSSESGGTKGNSGTPDGTHTNDEEELPHICFPLYTAADQFVVTPPGEAPPSLGSDNLGEPRERSHQRRSSGQFFYPFNTRDTYSFHFHSDFIDFAHWQVVNLPGLRNTDLRAFWDDMPLRIICYSLNTNSRTRSATIQGFHDTMSNPSHRPSLGGKFSAAADEAKSAIHSWAVKEYMLCLEITPQDPTAAPIPESNTAEIRPPTLASSPPRDLGSTIDAQLILQRLQYLNDLLSHFEIRVPAWFEYASHSSAQSERRVGYVIAVQTYYSDDICGSRRQKPAQAVVGEYIVLCTAQEAFRPVSFVQQLTPDSDRISTRVDSMSSSRSSSSSNSSSSSQFSGAFINGPRLFFGSRSRSFENLMSMRARSVRYKKIDNNRNFLECQLLKLKLDGMNSCFLLPPERLCAAKSALLDLIQRQNTPYGLVAEWPFLRACYSNSLCDEFRYCNVVTGNDMRALDDDLDSSLTSWPTNMSKTGRNCPSIQVLRVVGVSQWRSEWMTLNPSARTLRFFRTLPGSCKLTVSMNQVLVICKEPPAFLSCWCKTQRRDLVSSVTETSGGTSLYWLHLGLVGKYHHIAFASSRDQRKWYALLENLLKPPLSKRATRMAMIPVSSRIHCSSALPIAQCVSKLHLDAFAVDVCISESNLIKEKARFSKRFVLNECCFLRLRGTCVCTSTSTTEPSCGTINAEPDAGDLVRRCLRHGIELQSIRLDTFSTAKLLTFQELVCALRWVDLSPVLRSDEYDVENERKAFFLNLFHLMMIHANVLGLLPKSKAKWNKFFNGVTYNVGGLYFSLAEIEYCIIRAPMTTAPQPVTVLVLPKLGDPADDPRASFCLKRPDFRLNFGINYMTRSCWASVVVFDRSHVDEQLDHVTRATVGFTLLYDRDNRTVQLPKVCDWHRGDFAIVDSGGLVSHERPPSVANTKRVPPPLTTNLDILGRLLPYVRGPEGQQLEFAWQFPHCLVDKFIFAKPSFHFHAMITEAAAPDYT